MRNPKPCAIGGIAYPSQSAAAIALGLTKQRVHQLATGQSHRRETRASKSRSVTINGVNYESVAAAARDLGVSYWAARYLAKLGGWPRRRARRAAAPSASVRKVPPMRNAFKILQRTADILATSIWIARLPISQQCEITRARQILQEQAELLLAHVSLLATEVPPEVQPSEH